MTLVSLDARDRLPELVRLVAGGEKVVLTDGGRWVAALTAPPPAPPTPEEELERQVCVKEAIREWVRQAVADGYPPSAESKVWELLPEEERPGA